MSKHHFSIPVLSLFMLAGCGGGSSSSTGSLTIAMSDAPVDGVDQVVVQFSGVTLKPQGGAAFDVTFDQPVDVDLKALHSGNTELILDGQTVPAGRYEWIQLAVNAEFDSVFDSFVVEEGGGQVELRVPSGDNSGLKLVSGFTVVAGGESSFVIDWNLREGLVVPSGQQGYKLQPALRITDLQEYGTVEGTVDAALISDPACTSDPNTSEGNSVYVFAGAAIVPDDIDGTVPDPVTTAEVKFNEMSGAYAYRVSYLGPGSYTLAFTCQAADDNVPDDENPGPGVDDAIVFTNGADATVVAGQTVTVNF